MSQKKLLILILSLLALKGLLFYWGYINFDYKAFPGETLLSVWNRWDSKAYLTIAQEGYASPGSPTDYRNFLSHFPPAYSLAIRLFSFLPPHDPVLAGLLVSLISILAASYFLYQIVMLDFADERSAWLAVIFLNVFPTSYFTLAVYSESLFLLCTIAAFYYLRLSSFGQSGTIGFLAIITRLSGVTLLPAYLHAWIRSRSVKNALLLSLPVFGVVMYLLINKHYFGNASFFMQEYQGNVFTAKKLIVPFSETFTDFKLFLTRLLDGKLELGFMMTNGWNSLFTLFALAVTIVGIGMKMPWEYTIYSLSSILFFASFSRGISNARYVLSVFPIYVILSRIKSRLAVNTLLLSFVFLLMYFTRFYVRGWWAF